MLNKTTWLLAAFGYTATLGVVCLLPNDGLPYFGTNFEDKIYHLLAYSLLCFLWYKALTFINNKRAIVLSLVFSIIYGIVIEVLQGKLTETRDASITDIVANSIGVLIVSLILTIRNKTIVKKI